MPCGHAGYHGLKPADEVISNNAAIIYLLSQNYIMDKKGQSAIEFLLTYDAVFLIIVVVLAILIFFVSIPQSSLPLECSFYSGFNCIDIEYYAFGSGSQLVVLATNVEPGLVNVSNFSATVNYVQSTDGSCNPSLSTSGQIVYCLANFSSKIEQGQVYTATFHIAGDYCAKAASQIGTICPSSSSYLYVGNAKVSAQESPTEVYVNYTIAHYPSAKGNVLEIDGSNFAYSQLPLLRSYPYGTSHAILYDPTLEVNGFSYTFNTISGCGMTSEEESIIVTKNCTITATYNGIIYQNCPQIPNEGGQNLARVKAEYCNLVGYTMTGDNIVFGTIFSSDMANVNLAGSNLADANLSLTNLDGAIMTGVNFQGANLNGTDMQGSVDAAGSNFQGAILKYSDMEGISLSGANLANSNLAYSNLVNADLVGSNFANSDLAYADLAGADVSGANFNGANITDCTGCP